MDEKRTGDPFYGTSHDVLVLLFYLFSLNAKGFDFLGLTVRQFSVGKYKSSKDRWENVQGFKVIIRPSKEAVKRHLAKTKEITRKNRAKTQKSLIVELNSVIREWANYYKTQASKATFNTCDYYLW